MGTREKKLAKVIEKHITYDAGPVDECPHCHKEISERHYWIDHKVNGNIPISATLCSKSDFSKNLLDSWRKVCIYISEA
jgi:hypothetical protein